MLRIATFIAASAVAFGALAQQQPPKPNPEREALRRAQAALAKAQEERTTIQRERDEAILKLKSADDSAERARREAARVRGAVGAAETSAKTLRAELDQAGAKLAQTEAALAKTNETLSKTNETLAEERKLARERISTLTDALKSTEARVAQLSADGERDRGQAATTARALTVERDERGAQLAACRKDNAELAAVGYELMNRYDNKGVWASLKQNEPMFRLQSVETQNLLEKYRDRIDAARSKAK